jgi:hypothetical protein
LASKTIKHRVHSKGEQLCDLRIGQHGSQGYRVETEFTAHVLVVLSGDPWSYHDFMVGVPSLSISEEICIDDPGRLDLQLNGSSEIKGEVETVLRGQPGEGGRQLVSHNDHGVI